ncbi:serine hydrolase-domain-containing protein [Lentinula boryana]|uniref:Serine hydrolase-domain-containing protein n=1 Tax=Lentinula boryana TaxID=40481 RepID=A0ABQ8Q6C8_9AGAR|nr:serine hydrolase-domain-containing protein [Lentinula boryana]
MPAKVLVLHGYRQNAFYAYRKLAAIIAGCGDGVQFYFLDAPLIMVPADPKAHFGDTTDARYTLKPVPTCSTPTMCPPNSEAHRAWFKINDALFGFSQGAAMAEQIAAMLERPHLFPLFCENGTAPHPPLKFIACVSGFLIRGPKLSWESDSSSKTAIAAPEFGFATSTPALFVVGQTDVVVPPERSRIFVQHSKFNRVEEHYGGHFIPIQSRWRQFFISFFLNPFAEISSPTPSSVSVAPSDDEENYVTIPTRRAHTSDSYQTGRTLPCPDRPLHQENEPEEEQYLFTVVYDPHSDHELPTSSLSSPPDTPFLQTPELPVLELDEPSIVVQYDKYEFDAVADLFPSVPVSTKSKL